MKSKLEIGDLVKIRCEVSGHNGMIGEVIGIRYGKLRSGKADFIFRIKFSKRDVMQFDSRQVMYVKPEDAAN